MQGLQTEGPTVRAWIMLTPIVLACCAGSGEVDDDEGGAADELLVGDYDGTLTLLIMHPETGAIWNCVEPVTTRIGVSGTFSGAVHCEDERLDTGFETSWEGRVEEYEVVTGILEAVPDGTAVEFPLSGSLIFEALSLQFAGIAETELGELTGQGSLVGLLAE